MPRPATGTGLALYLKVSCGPSAACQGCPYVRNYDLEFLKRFSLVIGFLALVTFGLILAAIAVHRTLPPEVDPSAAGCDGSRSKR